MVEGAFIQFILWLALLMLISLFLERLWSRIFSGKNYQLLVFPGILVHEFSHALGCLISGAKINEISFFSSKGSYVKHGKPKIPVLGTFIIAFAPIAGGIALLWSIPRILGLSLPFFVLKSSSFFKEITTLIKELVLFTITNWENWIFWVFIYITISVVICLVPSKQDLKNSASSSLIILLILFLVSYFEVVNLELFLYYMAGAMAIGVFFGVIAIIFTIPIYFIKKLL